MPFIADFHIHSKYSLATSKDMEIGSLAEWAKIKGISMLGTGDFTHPAWFKEIGNKLESAGDGVYDHKGIKFILTAEVSNIYRKAGKVRRVHNMIFAPSFKAVRELNKALTPFGALASDGRPILKLECDRMVKMVSEIDPNIFFVPSHVWTPYFGVFGAKSGFDSLEECFEDETPRIFAIETGLSSDPAMNWRWSKLDRLSLISNSDSHSPRKIGREANVFSGEIDYRELIEILKTKDKKRFLYTIEFFPEEGKYHWDGHSACHSCLSPREAIKRKNICPICGKKITVGVAHQLEEIADRPEGYVLKSSPSFKSAVGLCEIISDALDMGAGSKRVQKEYFDIIDGFGTELNVLLYAPEDEIRAKCPKAIAGAILNVRKGALEITPGYDGEYGRIKVL